MLEILREAGTILKDLPELAIWILLGILVYKIFIVGGVIGLIKFAIGKMHSYLTLRNNNANKPKEIVTKYDIGARFIKNDGTLGVFNQLLDEVHTGVGINSDYIHKQDVQFLLDAVREKRARMNKADTKEL